MQLKTEKLRWGAIAAAGGCVVWLLVEIARGLAAQWNEGWGGLVFVLVYNLLILAPLVATTYFCWHRQYRKLWLVVGAAGAVATFILLMLMPEWLGIGDYFHDKMDRGGWQEALAGPILLFCIFMPIFAAAWFYRLCRRLAYRSTADSVALKPFKTQATRWLVWLGVLCMLLPTAIWMTLTFNQISQSAEASPATGFPNNAVYWIAGSNFAGVILIFVGLVRRRPKGTILGAMNAAKQMMDEG